MKRSVFGAAISLIAVVSTVLFGGCATGARATGGAGSSGSKAGDASERRIFLDSSEVEPYWLNGCEIVVRETGARPPLDIEYSKALRKVTFVLDARKLNAAVRVEAAGTMGNRLQHPLPPGKRYKLEFSQFPNSSSDYTIQGALFEESGGGWSQVGPPKNVASVGAFDPNNDPPEVRTRSEGERRASITVRYKGATVSLILEG